MKATIKQQPDGNIFMILGLAGKEIKNQLGVETYNKFKADVDASIKSGADYHSVLGVVLRYVDFDCSAWYTDDEEEEQEDE